MRFEELSYREDGRPVSVPFHPRLTVVGPLGGRARAGWIERALGVLLGTRAGDGIGLRFRDDAGRQILLQRDRHGAARITAVDTGEDYTPAAADLPLDGRFDWFASLGLDSASARALVCLRPDDFKGEDVDPWGIEDALCDARGELAQVDAEHAGVMARRRQAEELGRRMAELDDWLLRLEDERGRRRHGEALRAVRRLEASTAVLRRTVASERAAADAVLVAATAAEEWRRARDALEVASEALGERPLPEPTRPEPMEPDPAATVGRDLRAELEAVHRTLEAAERELDRARLPALAVAARRRMERARRREEALLGHLGFGSWLAMQMQRVDLLREPSPEDAREPVESPRHDPSAAAGEPSRDARLRHTLEEAAAACRAARGRLEAVAGEAGLRPDGGEAGLEALVDTLATRAPEAAAHRRTPPTATVLEQTEIELAAARRALATFGRPDWDQDPVIDDGPLPDPEPVLEERARLFEQAYHIENGLPDVDPLEERRRSIVGRIALLEFAARTGYVQKSVDESEMILLGRVTEARRVGPAGESVPLLVDDAFNGFDPEERLDLLHLLARLADATQIVYLTDDAATLEWALTLACANQALVVPPPGVEPSAVASVA